MSNDGFLVFNAVKMALRKAVATKLGSWPLLATFTILFKEFIARLE